MENLAIKKIDDVGRIVLPSEYRKTLGLVSGARVMVSMENNKLVIQPMSPYCKICGSTEDIDKDIPLCKSCLDKAKKTS